MKKIYLSLIILASLIFLFNFSVCIAIPPEYSVAMRLEQNQDKWDLVIDDDFLFPFLASRGPKEELIKFISQNKDNYTHYRETAMFTITVILFSVIGYCRERRFTAISKK
ncbi:hypothetical protein ACFL1E_00920 [Candidatus Omnitrophota bacterium]